MSEALLRAAFDKDDGRSRAEWTHWRETADLHALTPDELAALPLLGRRFLPWIEDDPAKPILVGICKQAWSLNQLRMRRLSQAVDLLRGAGLDPIVIGTAGTVLLSACGKGEGGFLAIPRLELLLRREAVPAAVAVLTGAGWRASQTEPTHAGSSVALRDSRDDWWLLRSRLISNPPDIASEAAVVRRVEAEWNGRALPVPSPAWQLADQLYRPEPDHWKAESLLLLQREIDWDEFRRVLECASFNGPTAERIRELRDRCRAQLPVEAPAPPGKFTSIWRDYRRWQAEAGGASRGPLPYLRTRWNARSNAQLPWLAMRMLAEFLTSRSTGAGAGPSA